MTIDDIKVDDYIIINTPLFPEYDFGKVLEVSILHPKVYPIKVEFYDTEFQQMDTIQLSINEISKIVTLAKNPEYFL